MTSFGGRSAVTSMITIPLVILISIALVLAQPGKNSGPPRPSQSSTIAISNDERYLANVNPDVGTVSIFRMLPNKTKFAEVLVGREPVSLAIHPRSPHAYVANALDGTVAVVNLAAGVVETIIPTDAQPAAVALSPSGNKLYIANSSSNSLVAINTEDFTFAGRVDLSPYGTGPRAIAVTNDGDSDDTDETIFVALFFSQLRPGKTATDEGQDDQREGRVVAIAASNLAVLGGNSIVLGPIANAGFNSNGKLAPGPGQVPSVASVNPQTFTTPTGAFPNQLAAIALQPGAARAYVVSTGASPNGPLRFNQMAQGLVSVFNTTTRLEVTSGQTDPSVRRTAPLNLNQGVNLATTPAPRLFLTNPVAMTWRPDGSDAWVVIQNSDAVARLSADGNGVPSIGAPLVAGPSQIVRVDLHDVTGSHIQGKAPDGIAISPGGSTAYVHNRISRSITTIDISNPNFPLITDTDQVSDLPLPGTLAATAHLGAELFFTGRGPDGRMSSESWGACIVCHPKGLSDGVTWMFDAGPRQTIPLDGMFSKTDPADQRILNWSAVRDENHDFELNTRGVFGGRGLIDDDRLFLAVGGANGAAPSDSALIEQFQQVTGSVTTTNDLAAGATLPNLGSLTSRRDFAIATLGDDRLYIIGGRSGSGSGSLVGTDAILEFNPRTNLLVRHNSSGFTRRHSLGAAAVRTAAGFRIYAVGGYADTAPGASPVNTVQEYNPSSDTWRTVASLPTAVAQFGITVAGGVNTAEPLQLIHVVGGNTASDAVPLVSAGVQRFQADPAGPGTWSAFAPAGLTARRNHGAATALRGVQSRVFIIGGENAAGMVLGSVEEYQAQAVTVVATPHTALPAARSRFGIGSSLSTNQIYVAGGIDGVGADQATVLEYTVANNGPVPGPSGTPSGAWVARGNLSLARRGLALSTPPGVTNFLPVQSKGRDARQDAIALWVQAAVFPSPAPVPASDPAAIAGRTLFGTVGLVVPSFSCATCHGGPKWTRSRVDYVAPPSPEVGIGLGNERIIGAELRQTLTQGPNVLINVGTFTLGGGRVNEIRFNGADISQAIAPLGANGFNIPSLLSVHETAPYFYSGLAQTLDQALNGSQDGNGGTRHHFVANVMQRAQLIAFLRSIDQTTPIFP
jgi:DNA-binding beta-propeller fold protein YncE